MKTMTISGVDDHLAAMLKPRPAGSNRELFEGHLGVWSRDDLSAFNAATADFETIDERDWR